MSDLVSILIPCYNADKWLRQSIKSALAQTYAATEIIVVDDGSTDNSLEIIQSFGDRLRWETGPNRGGNAARNRLLELARGKWLQYLDADDYLLPEKIDCQMNSLTDNHDVDVIFGPVILERSSGTEPYQELLAIPKPHDPWVLLARWFLPQTGAPLWRKTAIEEVGGWKVDQPCCQEHELYLRLLMAGKRFAYENVSGAVYRCFAEGTVSTRSRAMTRRERRLITVRLEEYLAANGELTEFRQWAIDQSRLEMARSAWASDREEARAIHREIASRAFRPAGVATPKPYQFVYRMFGFDFAEYVASTWRSMSVMRRAMQRGALKE